MPLYLTTQTHISLSQSHTLLLRLFRQILFPNQMDLEPGIAPPGKSKAYILFAAGLLFAILWPSAATATKIGLQHAQPFVICIARFFTAGFFMLFVTHGILRKRLPQKQEWKQLAIYGLLNITIYLGMYVLAMQHVSAGLGSLAVATNPVFISLITTFLFGHTIKLLTVISLLLCAGGVLLAAYPMLLKSSATTFGIIILMICMLVYSAVAIYFSKRKWNDLHNLTINGWQTTLGGLFLLPLALSTYKPALNHYDISFAGAVLWLAIPVSIIAVLLWLYLLKDNVVKASFWLFLCPVSGYVVANIIMHEAIGAYTIGGMALVMAGLYLVQRKR
jgi:drug/metabolite transporter (DMT)-like permease